MDNELVIAPLLTVKDVIKRLNISRPTINSLRKKGKLSAVVINDCVRFTEEEVERFIKESQEPKNDA